MDRRHFLLLVSLVVAAFPLRVDLAFADDGGDDGEDDSDDGGDDSSDDGGDDSSDDGGSDSGGGSDDGGNSGSDGNGGGSSGGTGNSSGTGSKTADHDRAQAAVAGADALPLKKLLVLFRTSYQGEVVDVTLLKRQSALVYRVKYVDPGGRVRRAEFDARTGRVLD